MNLNKLFYDWSSEQYADRNNLVFEGKNQAYGAYQIRQEYNQVLIKSMLTTFLGIALLACVPSILKYFSATEIAERVLPDTGGPELLDDDIFKVKPPIIPIKEVIPVSKPASPTIANLIPEVINKTIAPDDKFAANDKLLTSESGTTTSASVGSPTLPVLTIEPDVVEIPDETLKFAELMPSFVGGDGELYKYMQSNVKYPDTEKELGISGTVYVYFVINKFGKVEDAKIARGIRGASGLEREALRVIKSMPTWEPGRQNGKPVKVQFTYPVSFVLR